jgi:hypothetical protein
MTPDDVASELRFGLSELEESSLNVTGDAVTQDGNPVFILHDDEHPGSFFTVIVLPGDMTRGGAGAGMVGETPGPDS